METFRVHYEEFANYDKAAGAALKAIIENRGQLTEDYRLLSGNKAVNAVDVEFTRHGNKYINTYAWPVKASATK